MLARRLRGSDVLNAPGVVKDFLRTRLAQRPHEVTALMHLDSQLRVIDSVEMFGGSVARTFVYPWEAVIDALLMRRSSVMLVRNTRRALRIRRGLKAALRLIDVQVLDHLIVAGTTVLIFADRGLL